VKHRAVSVCVKHRAAPVLPRARPQSKKKGVCVSARLRAAPLLLRVQPPPETWGPQDHASQRAAGLALRAQLGRVPLSEALAGPSVYAWAQGILAKADTPADERHAPAGGSWHKAGPGHARAAKHMRACVSWHMVCAKHATRRAFLAHFNV